MAHSQFEANMVSQELLYLLIWSVIANEDCHIYDHLVESDLQCCEEWGMRPMRNEPCVDMDFYLQQWGGDLITNDTLNFVTFL